MATSTLSKITNPATGFTHNLNKILKEKCRIYIAKGSFAAADIPATIAALAALYSGANAKFIPLGDMDSTGSNITWTQKTAEIDFSTVGLGYEIIGTFVGVTVSKDMIDFVSNMGNDQYSFLFIPDGTNNVFYALNGVTVTTEGNLVVVENDALSKITFKASRKANEVNDAILYKELTGTGA